MFFVGHGVFYLVIRYDLGSPSQSLVLWWELKHRVPLYYCLGRYSAVFSLLDKLPALCDLHSLSKNDSMWKSLLWSRPIEDSSECVFLIALHNSTFCLKQEYSRNYRTFRNCLTLFWATIIIFESFVLLDCSAKKKIQARSFCIPVNVQYNQ